MTTFKSFMAGSLAFLMMGTALLTSAFASTEPGQGPSGESFMSLPASAEPSGEIGAAALFGSGDLGTLGELLFDAAGVGTADSDDIAALLENADIEELAAELRAVLDITQQMSDDTLRTQIVALAAAYGYSFSDAELDAIIRIIRSFEPLTVDELQAKLQQLRGGIMTVSEIREGVSSLGERIQAFIQKLIELFREIFGAGRATPLFE